MIYGILGFFQDTDSGNPVPLDSPDPIVVEKSHTKACIIATYGAPFLPIWKSKHPFKNQQGSLLDGDKVVVFEVDGGVFKVEGGYIHGAYTRACVDK